MPHTPIIRGRRIVFNSYTPFPENRDRLLICPYTNTTFNPVRSSILLDIIREGANCRAPTSNFRVIGRKQQDEGKSHSPVTNAVRDFDTHNVHNERYKYMYTGQSCIRLPTITSYHRPPQSRTSWITIPLLTPPWCRTSTWIIPHRELIRLEPIYHLAATHLPPPKRDLARRILINTHDQDFEEFTLMCNASK